MSFQRILNKLMTERNVSAFRLAKATGMSDTVIYYYKRGKIEPSAHNAALIADFFDVSLDYIMGRTQNPEINR